MKTALLALDPTTWAMFGAGRPGIDWQKVSDDREVVLPGIRGEQNLDRRFKMMWVFNYVMGFIKFCGRGHQRPIGLFIDEFT